MKEGLKAQKNAEVCGLRRMEEALKTQKSWAQKKFRKGSEEYKEV